VLTVNISGLASLSIYARDVDASKHFYGTVLGLPVVREEDWGVVVQAGDVQLFLHPAVGDRDRDRQRLELVFHVEDVDAAFADLSAAGATVIEEPTDREWGERDGSVGDPDGNTVYLSQPHR